MFITTCCPWKAPGLPVCLLRSCRPFIVNMSGNVTTCSQSLPQQPLRPTLTLIPFFPHPGGKSAESHHQNLRSGTVTPKSSCLGQRPALPLATLVTLGKCVLPQSLVSFLCQYNDLHSRATITKKGDGQDKELSAGPLPWEAFIQC